MAVDGQSDHSVPAPGVRSVRADDIEEFHNRRSAPPYCEECYETDVDKLDVYRMTGVNWNGMFCDRHDPRERAGESHMWELVNDGD